MSQFQSLKIIQKNQSVSFRLFNVRSCWRTSGISWTVRTAGRGRLGTNTTQSCPLEPWSFGTKFIQYNESPSVNIDMRGALFTLSLFILNSKCIEGAISVNVHRETLIIFSTRYNFGIFGVLWTKVFGGVRCAKMVLLLV